MKYLQEKLSMTPAQIVIGTIGVATTATLVVSFIVMAITNGIKPF
jgi:hypothetical protein